MTETDLGTLFDRLALAGPARLPDKIEGSAGIVTSAGGLSLTMGAWLLCHRLRDLGCTLPIEVVHAGTEVIPDRVRAAFPATVTFRALDAPPPGYAIKPLALWTSSFDRCLWLDADNLPLRDPSALVSRPGPACFWPDAFRTSSGVVLSAVGRPIEALEFESGQMVVPTRACARALWLARALNETYREVMYSHVHGDKDTWRLAWALAGEHADVVPYLPLVAGHRSTCVDLWPLPVTVKIRLPGTGLRDVGLVQHDREGRPLFLHRTVREWQLHDGQAQVSWTQNLTAQVEMSRARWRPDSAGDVPSVVGTACAWAQRRLVEIEWFPQAFGLSLPARLWLKHRFAMEAALASTLGEKAQ